MSTNAILSQGMTIARGDGASPEAFTAIPEVASIGGPSGTASVVDATDLSSTAKEKKLGLMDEGQVTLDIHYIPDNTVHEGLRTDRVNKTKRNFRITFTDASPKVTYTFAAYVTGFSVTAAVDQLVKASVTLEISGAITKA